MHIKYFFCLALVVSLSLCGGLAGDVYSALLQVPAQYATIGKALSVSSSGDTVQVAEGVYFEHITLKKGVTLEGGWNKAFSRRDVSAFETILDGAGKKGAVVKGADHAVIDGFTITHGSLLKSTDLSEGGGVYCRMSSPTIKNNIIKNNEPSGIFCESSNAVISGNSITANTQAGIYMRKGSSLKISRNIISENNYSGIGCSKGANSTFEITGNIIFKNKRSGINAEKGIGIIQNNLIYENMRAGIRCLPMPVTIVNNTVDRNGWVGIYIEDPLAVATIKNNIITHNVDSGIRTNGKGYDHNLLFSNGETGACDPKFLWCVKPQFGGYGDETSYLKKGNIIADPFFANWAGHDYHLQAISPAIDAGDKKEKFNDAHLPPSLGNSRNDMGFYGGPLTIAEKPKENTRPMAVAERELEVFVGQKAILDGKESIDPDGDAITYRWTLMSKPENSTAKLQRANRVKTAFKADVPGVYEARLVVTDRLGGVSEPQIVTISVPENRPPKASIGEVVRQVSAGDIITFYGSASKDPEGNELLYRWHLQYKPKTSQATLTASDQASSSFLVDVDGLYSIQLIVNDGEFDSEPVTVNVSTKNEVSTGVRRVPEEYPTIQSAIDAASPGDNVVVNGGHYKELVIIDKSVNLIGKDWPVIDGGSQPGKTNTVFVFPLSGRAGRVEGFIITGGGTGKFSHGINIRDSSPDIFNNKIFGNMNGIGIHGSPSLTGKAKIHGNLVYDNNVGIGNGKGSNAHIYNNRIYNNRIVGIGSRGKASPWIDANYIYGNRLGIGAREVTYPLIEGNHIFNNIDGIVMSPLSTIKRFALDDIVIRNNLIVNNDHIGINISSFNLSKVIITNNTIDSNNKKRRKIRGGGVLLGYPQAAIFTAVVEKNIISNNRVAGLSKYIGPETFPEQGARLNNDRNNLWNNTVDFVNCQAGDNGLSNAPFFDGNDTSTLGVYLQESPTGEATDLGYQFKKSNFGELPPEEL